MTGDPLTARPDWPLLGAIQTMVDTGVNRLRSSTRMAGRSAS